MPSPLQSYQCSYFDKGTCRSCSFLNKPKDEILKEKRNELISSFTPLLSGVMSKNVDSLVAEVVSPSNLFDSRAKVKLSVGGSVDAPVLGLVDKKFEVLDLVKCPLHYSTFEKLLNFIKSAISDYSLYPYQIREKTGELKGLILNSTYVSNDISVRFVLRSKEALDRVRKLVPVLQKNFPSVKLVSVNLQTIAHQILEGPEEIVLSKESVLYEKLFNTTLVFGPQSFTQVTPEVASSLYQKIADFFSIHKCKSFLDLYCGVGGFSMFAGPYVERSLGVEVSEKAVEYAKKSALINEYPHLDFMAADVNEFLESYQGKAFDVVLVNPPRRGLEVSVIDKILNLKPNYILYSSCSVESLERDLRLMITSYEIVSLTPFDMFPLSKHLEVLAVLKKN